MDITSIFTFFDMSKPCPDTITNCGQLRDSYNKEINDLPAGCKECDRISIRDKYIKLISK